MKRLTTMFERNLPPYLAHDLETWEKVVEEKSHLLDCLSLTRPHNV